MNNSVMRITRMTTRAYNDVDLNHIYVGSDNVKTIESYGDVLRVIYEDDSFLVYPMHRVLSVGGFMERIVPSEQIWDADPRANPLTNEHDGTCRHEDDEDYDPRTLY